MNMHLVEPIARKARKKLPACFELADLIGEGHLELLRAAESYTPRSLPFFKYARRRIRSAIYESVRRRKWRETTGDWSSSGDKRDKTTAVRPPFMLTEFQRPSTRRPEGLGPAILTEGKFGEDRRHLDEEFPCKDPSPEQLATESEQRRDIDQAIKTLNHKQARIIQIHYYGDETVKAAGERMQLTEIQAGRLQREALSEMRRYFKLRGRTAA